MWCGVCVCVWVCGVWCVCVVCVCVCVSGCVWGVCGGVCGVWVCGRGCVGVGVWVCVCVGVQFGIACHGTDVESGIQSTVFGFRREEVM